MTAPLLTYYADDFTGAADVLDSYGRRGVAAEVYLSAEVAGQSATTATVVGVAGEARRLETPELRRVVRAELEALRGLESRVVQYKICSTFDSSPRIGSIGAAAETAAELFEQPVIPVLVGAPALGRYVVFGNLFARSDAGSEIFRVDRHPVMSRHPVTPMQEADLVRLLATQTDLPGRNTNLLSLRSGQWSISHGDRPTLDVVDAVDAADLMSIGSALWSAADSADGYFVVGSSGVNEALLSSSPARVEPECRVPASRPVAPADSVLVVSGSRSAVTAAQVSVAARHGFRVVHVQAEGASEWQRARTEAVALLRAGAPGVVVDVGQAQLLAAADAKIGARLGELCEEVLDETWCRRLVVCGGDTSSQVARTLRTTRAEYLLSLAPGVPLCLLLRSGAASLEVAFKGGQLGGPDLLVRARDACSDEADRSTAAS